MVSRSETRTLRDSETYHKDAKGPPIGCERMTFSVDNLGCHVFYRSAKTVGLLVVDWLFAEAEVRQRNVTLFVKENTATNPNNIPSENSVKLLSKNQTIYSVSRNIENCILSATFESINLSKIFRFERRILI